MRSPDCTSVLSDANALGSLVLTALLAASTKCCASGLISDGAAARYGENSLCTFLKAVTASSGDWRLPVLPMRSALIRQNVVLSPFDDELQALNRRIAAMPMNSARRVRRRQVMSLT